MLPAVGGIVRDGDSRQPIEGALVRLGADHPLSAPNQQVQQVTNAKGQFLFTRLQAGKTYFLMGSAAGYLGWERTGEAHRIVIKSEGLVETELLLPKVAEIGGRVIDVAGDPVVGAFVRPLLCARIDGRDVWASGEAVLTDDRGVYRISGLAAGEYLVEMPSVQELAGDGVPARASPFGLKPNGAPLAPASARRRPGPYARHYFPSVTEPNRAMRISLRPGQTFEGANIALTLVDGFVVAGRVTPSSASAQGLNLSLVDADSPAMPWGSEVAISAVATDGRFVFANVPPGRYAIRLTPGDGAFVIRTNGPFTGASPADLPQRWSAAISSVAAVPDFVAFSRRMSVPTRYWTNVAVDVGTEDQENVLVPLRETGSASGTVVVSAPAPAGLPPDISVSIEPSMDNVLLVAPYSFRTEVSSKPDAPGPPRKFSVAGLVPGQYFLRPATAGLALRSLSTDRGIRSSDGEFVVEEGTTTVLEVALTTEVATVTGQVRKGTGPLATRVAIVCLPAPISERYAGFHPYRVQVSTPDPDGTFAIGGLAEGDYYVAVVDANDPLAYRDPARIQALTKAALRLHVGWGQISRVALEWPAPARR